uniref:ras GTPase-activating protein 1-like n=1 Tax=Styela clava TaxID=7725 RepID=UPI00193AA817|nr:ras GTPase-activating protein 1-like [Styela clava]
MSSVLPQQFGGSHHSYFLNQPTIASMDESVYMNEEIHEDDLIDMMDGSYDVTRQEEADTPPPNQWYHGKLDRNMAEERLVEAGLQGGYLVRESDRRPGSYVLSFFSITGITHFRILAVCGDFYIGGRQFDSLSQLIAYYSFKSCLLQDEMLEAPVAPPEPVDDRKRVKAILPYQAIPGTDNDELSFEKNDVFIVQNEMGGEWIWVTSLRTNESGCVFKGLVKDLDHTVDPHEGKEWFHSIITKEQAYNLLMAYDRVGSYLIRPSDSTPGDYVLYFYTGKSIQRFKIHRKHYNRFEMGGRLYNSIDEIVQHYKNEQIVQDLYLQHAVAQTADVSRECTNDIYQTIQREGQVGRGLFDYSNVVKRGFLYRKGVGKRGYETKKWKHMFFVLDGQKQHLYYFEHDKKTKPKGLVDLSYGAVYPIHDSYFGRPHCFQIVVHALNEVTASYYCADSQELAQEWLRLLRANCKKPNRQPLPNPRRARQVRSLSVTIDSCRKLPGKGIRTYCTLALNQVNVGRTKVKLDNGPVWNEEFHFDDIPPDVDSISVSVHNAAKKKHPIGETTVHFSKLSAGRPIDEWYNLSAPTAGTAMPGILGRTESFLSNSSAPAQPGSLGSVRVKAKFTNELIMPVDEYLQLKSVLLGNMEVIFALADICGQDRNSIASVLLKIFRDEKRETDLLCALNEREIMAEDAEPGTLFRATTLASTLMEQYMRSTCASFVSLALKDLVKQITDSKQSCELNPAKLPEGNDVNANRECLLDHLRAAIASIIQSQSIFPKELRYIFGQQQQLVQRRWRNDKNVRTRVVSGFVFLRLLCPAIITPKMFNIISESPSPVAARNLLLVAKSIQNLANLIEFGAKESYMGCVNSFLIENKVKIVQFIDDLGNKGTQSKQSGTGSYGNKVDISRDLALLHHVCMDHLLELQTLSTKKPFLKTFLGVLELLNQRQVTYLQKLREER